MSNQEFSNNTKRYSDQITPFTLVGTFQPSGTAFTANVNFRKNGNTVIIKILSDNQTAMLITDKWISIDTPIPSQFVPLVSTTIFAYVNYNGTNFTDYAKWTFLNNGGIIITSKNSTYPTNPLLTAQPAFGVTIMGAIFGTYTYTLT